VSLRVGQVGLGYWGRNLARVFHDEADLAWVCDASEALREEFARRYPDARVTGEFAEMISSDIEAVVVATPRFGCATADVYRAWDELGGPRAELDDAGANDLEAAAHRVAPALLAFKQAVQEAARARAILAGSGSSYAVVFDHRADAERARARIADAIDGSVWLGTAPA